METIGFNKPYTAANTTEYVQAALQGEHLSGNGPFTKLCHTWLEEKLNCEKALLTHSGTAALEMAILLAGIQPGDEVIMPSFSFSSTANAVVLQGGVPVFVDIREDTLNIDETQLETAVTDRTKAILVVHYAGVACEMNTIMALAEKYHLLVIEDAAHALLGTYKGKALGSIGHFGAISFHETKNISSGEGGVLLINDGQYNEQAEIIWEKGTNRSKFYRGEIDKYQWIDKGSSYLPGEVTAAMLWAQLEEADNITGKRLSIWQIYHKELESLEQKDLFTRPQLPEDCQSNGHLYYILLPDVNKREALRKALNEEGVEAVFHYLPLHLAPAGQRYGRCSGTLPVTEAIADRLLRLPLWMDMNGEEIQVCTILKKILC